jgi:hypothetical protein
MTEEETYPVTAALRQKLEAYMTEFNGTSEEENLAEQMLEYVGEAEHDPSDFEPGVAGDVLYDFFLWVTAKRVIEEGL